MSLNPFNAIICPVYFANCVITIDNDWYIDKYRWLYAQQYIEYAVLHEYMEYAVLHCYMDIWIILHCYMAYRPAVNGAVDAIPR